MDISSMGQTTPWGAMISEAGKVITAAVKSPDAIPTDAKGSAAGAAYSSSPWDLSNWTIATGGSRASGGGSSGGASAGVSGGASAAATPFSLGAPVGSLASATGIPADYLMVGLIVVAVILIKKKAG